MKHSGVAKKHVQGGSPGLHSAKPQRNVCRCQHACTAYLISPGYALLRRIREGMPVVDSLAGVPTGSVAGLLNVPLSEVVLVKAVQTR